MNIEVCKIMYMINMVMGKYLKVRIAYGYVCSGARLPGL